MDASVRNPDSIEIMHTAIFLLVVVVVDVVLVRVKRERKKREVNKTEAVFHFDSNIPTNFVCSHSFFFGVVSEFCLFGRSRKLIRALNSPSIPFVSLSSTSAFSFWRYACVCVCVCAVETHPPLVWKSLKTPFPSMAIMECCDCFSVRVSFWFYQLSVSDDYSSSASSSFSVALLLLRPWWSEGACSL